MIKNTTLLKIVFNSLLGLVLIFIWTKFVNISQIYEILKTTNPKFVLLFIVIFMASTLVRSLRLKMLLNEIKIPFLDIAMLNYLSQFLSFMIPIRAGEVSKSVYLSSQYNIPFAKTVVWVFIDRFLDFWTFLIMIALLSVVVTTKIPPQIIRSVMIAIFILTILAVISIKSDRFLKKLMDSVSLLLVLPKLKAVFIKFTHSVIEGFTVLRRGLNEILLLILLSIVSALLDGLIIYMVFLSLGAKLDFLSAVLGNLFLGLTFLIPTAPGYVGSAEAAGLAVFSGLFGINPNLASAVTVLFHVLTLLMILILGISSLYFLKFDLRLVWEKIKGS